MSEMQNAQFLRELDSIERFHWLMCLNHSNHIAMAAEISGATTPEMWRYALRELQQRHPFLNASIDRNANSKLAYRWFEGRAIPLVIKDRKSPVQWQEEFELEMATPFDPSIAPLIRVLLLQGGDRCDVIVVAHHTVVDGMSLVFIMRDLMQALSGKALEILPVPASQEQFYVSLAATRQFKEHISEASRVHVSETAPKPVDYYRPRKGEGPQVQGLRLSKEQTSLLIERTREEQTTVHAALCAALVTAGRKISASWSQNGVRVLSPISTRKALNLGEDSVLAVTAGIVMYDSSAQTEFWELARWSKRSLAPAQDFENIVLPKPLQDVVAYDDDDEALAQLMKLGLTYDLVVTNVQRVPYESNFGHLSVKALWGPSALNGILGEQAVGVATVNGTLCLLHTSYSPLDSLLKTGIEILTTACKGRGISHSKFAGTNESAV